MRSLRLRSRTALILPIVLLVVVIIEEIALYELRKHVRDPYLRTAAALAFFGVAFVLAVEKLGPALARLLIRARSGARERGAVGLWLFYAVAYGAIYWAFFVLETRGAAGLLPAAWR